MARWFAPRADGLRLPVVHHVAGREPRRASPDLGLALVPLFFAYRGLFSYFFLLPLFAFDALARMPMGERDPEHARAAGAITLFALPGRVRGGREVLREPAPAGAD